VQVPVTATADAPGQSHTSPIPKVARENHVIGSFFLTNLCISNYQKETQASQPNMGANGSEDCRKYLLL
jgi:hypothetical protein